LFERNIKNKERIGMKKGLFIIIMSAVVISMVAFPAYMYADTGDTSVFASVPSSGTDAGQYYVDPAKLGENIPVFCIDEHGTTWTGFEYTEQSTTIANALHVTTQELAQDAEALKILATIESGGTPVENQLAAWNYSDGNAPGPETDTYATTGTGINITQTNVDNANKIVAAVDVIAAANTDLNTDGSLKVGNDINLSTINKVVVTLDSLSLGTDTNSNGVIDSKTSEVTEHTATATMENPLVPTVTDNDKDTFWYILAGSYNVSFEKSFLLTEKTTKMNDVLVGTDNDGVATTSYYYYYWGLTMYPENSMNANILAWVDIDEDSQLDIVSIQPAVVATAYTDPVSDMMNSVKVVLVDDKGTVSDFTDDIVKIDSFGMPQTASAIVIDNSSNPRAEKFDIHQVAGGKVLTSPGHQTLLTIASDEPYAKSAVIYTFTTPSPVPDPTPTPVPPVVPPAPTPSAGVVTVAALTEGIQVLAFTGQDPIIPIAGLTALIAGLAMVVITFSRRQTLKWKHVKR
jgi:hypothetical protein